MQAMVPAFLGFFTLQMMGCTRKDAPKEVRVLTDRTASHLETIFEYYEKAHGVKINTNFVGEGLLARLEARPQEADLVITKNADLLELARQKDLLAKISSQTVSNNVPEVFRDPKSYYMVLSFRARAIFYAKDRVSPADLDSYDDLILPKWKGRVCIRSGFHEYNVSWLSQMAVSEGIEHTETFIKGLRDNLARPPKGNDRAQVRALLEKECDVAVANSYYMGIMLQRDDQKAWAQASSVFFPDQAKRGAYVMRSGAALTRATKNQWRATKLLEYLTSDFAQRYFSEALYEYPVKKGVPLAPINAELGKEQGIEGGACKINLVSLREAAKYRDRIIEILTRTNLDRK
jgi:iron(III) transport system substrate-binding protein